MKYLTLKIHCPNKNYKQCFRNHIPSIKSKVNSLHNFQLRKIHVSNLDCDFTEYDQYGCHSCITVNDDLYFINITSGE
jgi:hypothetical protein